MRIAAFDIGTNNVLMLVAELRGGELVPLLDLAAITRLGRGVDKARRLDEAAVALTLDTIERFWSRARALGVDAASAVGTAAMREAGNGEAFGEHVRALVGADVEIVSGDREAALTFAGAASDPSLPDGLLGVIDVGGGSTELVIGERVRGAAGAIAWGQSYDVGSVRLYERLLASDPPTPAQRDAVDASVAHAFGRPRPPIVGELAAVVALAGTATTYAAIDARARGQASGFASHLEVARVDQLCSFLARLPLSSRKRVPGLDPGRADVIVAGGTVLMGAARALGARELRISDRGVRHGLALERLVR